MVLDVEQVLLNKIPESQKLEYKDYYFKDGKFNQLSDNNKNKLAKEISSFANAEGGTIVIGVGEDDKHNPTSIKDVGVDEDSFEIWEQSFRQYISAKIKPVIYGIECNIQEVDGKILILIEVPDSLSVPHAFNDGNKDTFHIRYGNTTNAMRLEELKTAFQSRELIEQKILKFRDDRLSKIISGEKIDGVDGKAMLILHLIPEWSMCLNSYVNLDGLKDLYKLDVFSPERYKGSDMRAGYEAYNHEGLQISAFTQDNLINSYTQAFYNGAIESVEIRMMNKPSPAHPGGTIIYRWDRFEEYLVLKIKDFIDVLEEIGIPKPYYIFTTLLNAKGMSSVYGEWGDPTPGGPLKSNIIKIVPAYFSDDTILSQALLPMITNLAHVFGFKYSSLYNQEGELNSDLFKEN